MRWKLLRRRLSVSAPRMIVRSHLPWPLRWAVGAVALGFSAALALWAFEFGREIAGLDRGAKQELAELRAEVARLRADYTQARHVSDTAASLLRAEQTAQERLAQQLRQLEADKQALQADLGFFERLLPSTGSGLQVRGVQAEAKAPGQLRFQMLVVQSGKDMPEFNGRYELVLSGLLDGRPWALPGVQRPLTVRQVARVDGMIEHLPEAVIKAVQVKLIDAQGATRATQTLKL